MYQSQATTMTFSILVCCAMFLIDLFQTTRQKLMQQHKLLWMLIVKAAVWSKNDWAFISYHCYFYINWSKSSTTRDQSITAGNYCHSPQIVFQSGSWHTSKKALFAFRFLVNVEFAKNFFYFFQCARFHHAATVHSQINFTVVTLPLLFSARSKEWCLFSQACWS